MKLTDAYGVVSNSINNNIPVMLWGPPGIGKSSLIHQISAERGCEVLDLRLAQLDPTDLRGVPMPNKETGRSEWYLSAFWPMSADRDTEREVEYFDKKGKLKTKTVKVSRGDSLTGPGIVFLDEIEKAPVSVKNASLELVLDRRIGQYQLPNDWAIVCAGNREEDGAFSSPIGSALSNRMIHLNIEADVDSWSKWARNNDVVDDVIGFLHFSPHLLYNQTEEHAFPTPRSWVMGSNLLKTVNTQKAGKELLTAAVGRGAASEFTVWNNVYKSVDPSAIFKGEMPDFGEKEQSFKYAVTLAAAFYLRKRKGGIKSIEKHVSKFMAVLPPELRVIFLKQQTINVMEAMAKHPAFQDRIKEVMAIAT